MQFEDKNQDYNENNGFSLDDDKDNSISWDDLVNEDEEVDVSDMFADDENVPQNDGAKSAENHQNDDGIVNISSPEFNIKDTANNYVNSLDISETTVDLNAYGEQGEMMRFEDGSPDNAENSSFDKPSPVSGEQNSDFGGFDNDILSMLDNNQDEQDTINNITFNTTNQDNTLSSQEQVGQNYQNQSYNGEQQETQYQRVYPNAKPKATKTSLALIILIGFVGLVAIIFMISKLMPSKVKVLEDKDLTTLKLVVDGVVVEERYVPHNMAEAEKKKMEAAGKGEVILEKKTESSSLADDEMTSPDEEGMNTPNSNRPAIAVQETRQSVSNKQPLTIVSLSYGGRKNPFLPQGTFGSNVSASDLFSPPDLASDDPAAIEASKLLTIKVTGIVYDTRKPSAIVNFAKKDYFVQTGDRIDTYNVSRITKEAVSIQNGTNIYTAKVGEEFILEEKIPESKQMKYGPSGHRQYISSDDIQISTK